MIHTQKKEKQKRIIVRVQKENCNSTILVWHNFIAENSEEQYFWLANRNIVVEEDEGKLKKKDVNHIKCFVFKLYFTLNYESYFHLFILFL